jgi:hypothetical protein
LANGSTSLTISWLAGTHSIKQGVKNNAVRKEKKAQKDVKAQEEETPQENAPQEKNIIKDFKPDR